MAKANNNAFLIFLLQKRKTMKLRFKLLILNLFTLIILSASTSSEAEKYYKAETWSEAELLYARLLKNAPSNRIYNHRYGVCLLEQGKNLAEAEQHLRIAQKQGIALSNYYLGRVCFLQYKFDEAMDCYDKYIKSSTDKERKALAEAKLPQCEQASSMLKRTEDVEIIDRIMVDRSSFFKHYELSNETGILVEDPQVIGEDSICDDCTIYMTERRDRTFFSVNTDSTGIDLFYKNKLLNQWSEMVSLGKTVNTPYDEAYPFLMSDGVVLYFSSKGHNALGGYDLFVTRFNAAQNAFLPPQQLGMPFNSPSDDMLFVIDEYHNIGWFASDRLCPSDQVYIYTFVPNGTISLINTENKEVLRQAAMIDKVTTDTSKIINVEVEKHTKLKTHKPLPQKEIYLILNDTLIYSDLNDFMSDDAKELYINYLSSVETCDSIAQKMKEKRLQYSNTNDPKAKSNLISAIVNLEGRQLELGEQRDQLQQSVRRLELETIRINGGYKKPMPKEVAAPKIIRETTKERHISPWESAPASIAKDSVTEAYFYNKSLLGYYRKIYSSKAVNELIEANRLRIKATDKLLLADYVMKEYGKPEPEEGFFEKIFAYDSSFSEKLPFDQMVKKVSHYRDEASQMMIESSLNNYYTLHGQNVLLLESVNVPKVRQQMVSILDNATFAMQEAKQQLYVTGNTLTDRAEKRSRGNGLLRKSIQYQEAASLIYLQYRYEKAQELKAQKPKPVDTTSQTKEEDEARPAVVERKVEQTKTISSTPLLPKEEYRIQFGIFSRLLKDGDVALTDISYYQYSEKKIYKHYTGHFNTPMEAAMGLEAVKNKGFKDAYVVKFVNGKPE